jgi:hypothetical protein
VGQRRVNKATKDDDDEEDDDDIIDLFHMPIEKVCLLCTDKLSFEWIFIESSLSRMHFVWTD